MSGTKLSTHGTQAGFPSIIALIRLAQLFDVSQTGFWHIERKEMNDTQQHKQAAELA